MTEALSAAWPGVFYASVQAVTADEAASISWEDFEPILVGEMQRLDENMSQPGTHLFPDRSVLGMNVLRRADCLAERFSTELSESPSQRQYVAVPEAWLTQGRRRHGICFSYGSAIASDATAHLANLAGHVLCNFEVAVADEQRAQATEIASTQDWLDAAVAHGVRKASLAPGIGVNFDGIATPVAITWSGLLAIADGIMFDGQLLFADTIGIPHVRWSHAFIENVDPSPTVHLFGPEYGIIDPPDEQLLAELLISYLDPWRVDVGAEPMS